MKRTKKRQSALDLLLCVVKVAVLACILTAVLVLLLAVTMRWNWLGATAVSTVNTGIKAVSACAVGWMLGKKRIAGGWVYAGAAGVLYMVVAFALFGILNGGFSLGFSHVTDALMAFACAACTCIACGILDERRAGKAQPARQKPGGPVTPP